MDRQRKADMMLVLATGFWGISNCLIAICLRDMQPVTAQCLPLSLGLRRARRGVSQAGAPREP